MKLTDWVCLLAVWGGTHWLYVQGSDVLVYVVSAEISAVFLSHLFNGEVSG